MIMKPFTPNSALIVLAPVFLVASDFIATKFSGSGGKAAASITTNKAPVLLSRDFRFYNTTLKKFSKEIEPR